MNPRRPQAVALSLLLLLPLASACGREETPLERQANACGAVAWAQEHAEGSTSGKASRRRVKTSFRRAEEAVALLQEGAVDPTLKQLSRNASWSLRGKDYLSGGAYKMGEHQRSLKEGLRPLVARCQDLAGGATR